MSENKTSKYIKYALGEILLVMIGILLALQVNNWNEGRKEKNLGRTYLMGILDDLKTDTSSINGYVIPNFIDRHRVRHQYLDSLEANNLLMIDSLVAKVISPLFLATSGSSFHPTVGTYNSLISEGNTSIINNKELLNAIQELYEVWYKRNNEYGNRRDKLMDDIFLKHSYSLKYESRKVQLQNQQLLADISIMLYRKREYVGLLRDIELEVVMIIKEIENLLLDD